MSTVSAVQLAITFIWLGMVLAISFLEAPLKFRAPGITIALGVGIGRLVFRALNAVEAAFALTLIATLAFATGRESWLVVTLIAGAGLVLVLGAAVLRPAMDRRVRRGQVSPGVPRHRLHLWFVLLECVKVALLLALGISVLQQVG